MKRFWLVLLSLGLIVAFSTSAMALDVKFSGEYYAAGMYLDKTNLTKSATNGDPSTAFYFQRLRLGTQFVVSPGLSLNVRADIMERAWGAARTAVFGGALDTQSAGTREENENIAFDLLYVSYASPIGLFGVGYQIDGVWGTVFGDTAMPTPKITYVLPIGSFAIGLQTGKVPDGERSFGTFAGSVPLAADRDDSFYTAFVRYAWKEGDAGFLVKHIRSAENRNVIGDVFGGLIPALATTGYQIKQYAFVPYVKAKFGPVALQAELTYATGKVEWDGAPSLIPGPPVGVGPGPQQDQDINAMSGWIDATADFGMFYAGGTFAYVSGDDEGTADKREGGLSGGLDWNPCLIMFNGDLNYWVGNLNGYGTTTTTMGGALTNAYFLQARAGVRPIDKLDIALSLSWATADKTLGGLYTERDMGTEIDLTATYKITNNLSYMLGGGYWIVGDYYKGDAVINNDLQDNLLILNKLTLTF
ncbi:MAG: hypothetical protein PHF23_01190 [Smithellaceae bacterium]|nr:hypothetical protein [Smithellaceae bacterium]